MALQVRELQEPAALVVEVLDQPETVAQRRQMERRTLAEAEVALPAEQP